MHNVVLEDYVSVIVLYYHNFITEFDQYYKYLSIVLSNANNVLCLVCCYPHF